MNEKPDITEEDETVEQRTRPVLALIFSALLGPFALAMTDATRSHNSQIGFLDVSAISVWAWSVVVPLFMLMGAYLIWLARRPITALLWARLRAGDAAVSLVISLLAISLMVLTTAVDFFAAYTGDRVKDVALVAPVVVVGFVMSFVASILMAMSLWDHLRWVADRLPASVLRLVSLGLLMGAIIYPIYSASEIIAKDIRWDPAVLLMAAAFVSLATFWTPVSRGVLKWGSAALIVCFIGALFEGPRRLNTVDGLEAVMCAGHGLSCVNINTIRSLVDRDGDGFSPMLGGGDCDDTDAATNPLGVDIPGNGVDEDCRDGDRKAFADAPEALIEPEALSKKMVRRWNVLVLTIDSVRADHLDLYGYERPTAPTLRELAKQGLTFERAYSPSNSTRYTLPVMFSGRPLSLMNLERLGGFMVMGPGNELLFERLQKGGWHTAAHLPRQLARGMWLGLDQGFDRFVEHADAKLKGFSVKAITDGVLKELKDIPAGKPWAIWAHLLEPHEPYKKHKKYPFGGRRIDRYDAEIRASDEGLKRIMTALRREGFHRNTLVVVTSDHGEEFNDHGRKFHGKQLYEESIRVPLVIHVPGASPVRVQAPVTLMDLPATIAQFTGLEIGADYGALSLAPAVDGWSPPQDRPIFAQSIKDGGKGRRSDYTMIQGSRKIIYKPKKQQAEFYDLRVDPLEKKNLVSAGDPSWTKQKHRLMKEISRVEYTVLNQQKARRVSQRRPTLFETPKKRLPGLTWWGADLDTRIVNGAAMLQIRNWFEAVGDRKDYRLRLEVMDSHGKIRRKWHYAPLSGMYPTQRWKNGEVVEDARLIRFRKLSGELRIRMSLWDRKKRVAGPSIIGKVRASDFY